MFTLKGMIHVRVCIRCEPKPSSPQSSELGQSENTETSSSLMHLQRLENFFLDFKFLNESICSLSLLRVVRKNTTSSPQLNCLKTSFVALLMER